MVIPQSLTALDGVIFVVLALAIARGLYRGLVREAFSMASLAAGLLAARYFTEPAAAWLVEVSHGQIGSAIAPWLAGTMIAIGSVIAVGMAGRLVRRAMEFAGLSWADRMGGAAIGVAEGTLISAVIMLIALLSVGRQHPAVAESRSLLAWDRAVAWVEDVRTGEGELPHVSTPGS